jgi:hypothetical protein
MSTRGATLAILFLLSGCTRSGGLYGDVAVQLPSGNAIRGARISVRLIPSTERFEHDWAATVAAFQNEVAPAAEALKAAEHRAEAARLAWDHSLAAGNKAGRQRRAHRLPASAQPLWQNYRATESQAFQAKKDVEEIVRKHEARAEALLDKYAIDRVQTDETGHYVLVKVPAGTVYVYCRFREKDAPFTWFIPTQVKGGIQRLDLTRDNLGSGWPFAA